MPLVRGNKESDSRGHVVLKRRREATHFKWIITEQVYVLLFDRTAAGCLASCNSLADIRPAISPTDAMLVLSSCGSTTTVYADEKDFQMIDL